MDVGSCRDRGGGERREHPGFALGESGVSIPVSLLREYSETVAEEELAA
jgi:hypothetical protein